VTSEHLSAQEGVLAPEQLLTAAAVAAGDSVGLIWRDESFVYRELGEAALELRADLQAANGGADPTRVGVAVPSGPAWLPLVQAVWDGGGQAVLISAALPPSAVVELARQEDVDVLVVDEPLEQWAAWERGLVGVGGHLRATAVRATASPRLPRPSPHGPGIVLFTSGTTGRPKAVHIENTRLNRSLQSTLRQFGSRLGDVRRNGHRANIVTFPLYHISGLFLLLLSVAVWRPAVLLDRFTVTGFVDALQRTSTAHVILNPTMIRKLLDSVDEPTVAAVSRLRTVRSGSAPLPAATREAFERTFGVPILEGYGATETAGEIAGWTLRDHSRYGAGKVGSVGRPHPGTTIEIRDADGTVLPVGQVGAVWVKGPTTRDAFVDTRDLGHLDTDGFLFLSGRADDTINCGGFKIAPITVERVLEGCPGVRECMVVAEADEALGQIPVAYVVGEGDVEPEAISRFARQHLAAYECPRRIHLVDALPRNELGKVLRRPVTSSPEGTTP
jgi:acyl-CoA synthetase (AMP-forming)/AMP-acid ligase II